MAGLEGSTAKWCNLARVLCFDFAQLRLCAFRLILLAGGSGAACCLSRVLVRFPFDMQPPSLGRADSGLFISPQPRERQKGPLRGIAWLPTIGLANGGTGSTSPRSHAPACTSRPSSVPAESLAFIASTVDVLLKAAAGGCSDPSLTRSRWLPG